MSKAIFWDLQGTLGGEATADIDTFVPYTFSKSALHLSAILTVFSRAVL